MEVIRIPLRRLLFAIGLSSAVALCCSCSETPRQNSPADSGPDSALEQDGLSPGCSDGAKTGDETDVDCGGSCKACAAGKACVDSDDCQSGSCGPDGLCEAAPAASCNDGAKNQGEQGIDCGGPCAACASPVEGTLQLSADFPTAERGRSVYLWVEKEDGTYVDTIEQYMGRSDDPSLHYTVINCRFPNDRCDQWQQAAGEWPPPTCNAAVPPAPVNPTPLVLDGVMKPSVLRSIQGHYDSEVWDCRDVTGKPIPKGTYKVRVEIGRDGDGHPMLPKFYDEVSIDLSAGSTSASFANVGSDATIGTLTLQFTAK